MNMKINAYVITYCEKCYWEKYSGTAVENNGGGGVHESDFR